MELLDYTNKSCRVAPKLESIKTPASVNPVDLLPVREALWKNTEIIDQFILMNSCSLNQQDLAVISSWKRKIKGKFILLKHLKNYSVFMNMEEDGRIFAVTGISDAISNMFDSSKLPMILEAVLIPFEEKIIYDGLFMPYPIRIGKNMRKNFNEQYNEIKKKYGITTSI